MDCGATCSSYWEADQDKLSQTDKTKIVANGVGVNFLEKSKQFCKLKFLIILKGEKLRQKTALEAKRVCERNTLC